MTQTELNPSEYLDEIEAPPEFLCYIGLGSNLTDPVRQLERARATIRQLDGVAERAFSGLYRSKPMGPQDQPDYVNAVMAIATRLPAPELLHSLQAIETAQGRVRSGERWGPRTLDLDILLYGDRQFESLELTVPHRGIAERAFVLYPLYEIAPELTIPGLGSLAELLESYPDNGLERIDAERA
jgi:2-amino-4-hydroxy-6-hydroxymethyldihydropteridine diphosphokinase